MFWLDLLTLTLQACGVQRETFRAFAVEASRRVDTGGAGPTHRVLGCTLVIVCRGHRSFRFSSNYNLSLFKTAIFSQFTSHFKARESHIILSKPFLAKSWGRFYFTQGDIVIAHPTPVFGPRNWRYWRSPGRCEQVFMSFDLFIHFLYPPPLQMTLGCEIPHYWSALVLWCSPMQAVWCWVKPGGHLQVKPPMVLTQRNWQLCCLVEHSSRSRETEENT